MASRRYLDFDSDNDGKRDDDPQEVGDTDGDGTQEIVDCVVSGPDSDEDQDGLTREEEEAIGSEYDNPDTRRRQHPRWRRGGREQEQAHRLRPRRRLRRA